uniref:Uncharacterized protein n=1 Tax=Arundo donax TaxID=35708 RepID=A0A0A9F4N8_ARUDO
MTLSTRTLVPKTKSRILNSNMVMLNMTRTQYNDLTGIHNKFKFVTSKNCPSSKRIHKYC